MALDISSKGLKHFSSFSVRRVMETVFCNIFINFRLLGVHSSRDWTKEWNLNVFVSIWYRVTLRCTCSFLETNKIFNISFHWNWNGDLTTFIFNNFPKSYAVNFLVLSIRWFREKSHINSSNNWKFNFFSTILLRVTLWSTVSFIKSSILFNILFKVLVHVKFATETILDFIKFDIGDWLREKWKIDVT